MALVISFLAELAALALLPHTAQTAGELPATPSEEPQAEFLVFDQRSLAQPGDGFADQVVVYIPQDRRTATGCRIHIALDGCEQSREGVGEVFIRETGFAEVADTEGERGQLQRVLGLVGLYWC